RFSRDWSSDVCSSDLTGDNLMGNIKFGSEVYTWFMQESGKAYDNKLDHMIKVAAESGFTGIEPMHFWMGDLADASKLKDCLAAKIGRASCRERGGRPR